MPQVFQVLRCYKCSIFQVHQTKKDNKWKCKVCGEKQSIKRHYGIGTAKDCRMHVQKLNNMRGDVEESKLKAIDSDESDYEDNTENVDKNEINNTQIKPDNVKKESKWSAYVEKEEIAIVKETENIDDVEVCLELPQKRKINRKSKPFKVPKAFNECNKNTEIISKLPNCNSDELITSTHKDNSNGLSESRVRNQSELNREKKGDIYKSTIFQTTKDSKWAQYIVDENGEADAHYGVIENDDNHLEENIGHGDYEAEYDENNYHQKEEREYNYQQHFMDGTERHQCKEIENDNHKSVTGKPIFSLCDDNDLDNILDF